MRFCKSKNEFKKENQNYTFVFYHICVKYKDVKRSTWPFATPTLHDHGWGMPILLQLQYSANL